MNNIFINKNIVKCLKSELKKFDFTNEDLKEIEKINLCAFDFGNKFISNSLEDLKNFPNLLILELTKYILNKPNIEVVENLGKVNKYMFYNCCFKDNINISGSDINVVNCQNISYINFNNFENIIIQNCDISNIKFNNCKKIELNHITLSKDSINYISSLNNSITLIECKFDENIKFFDDNIIIIKKRLLGGE